MTEATTRPAAGGSYIRNADGSIRRAQTSAPKSTPDPAGTASPATDAPETKPGAQPKKRK